MRKLVNNGRDRLGHRSGVATSPAALVAALLAALLGVWGVPALAAGATPMAAVTSCGQVVVTDAVLHTDLTCAGDALIVAANDVTVRMDGHRISSSDGTGTGIMLGTGGTCATGVHLRGGTITGFAAGVSNSPACQGPIADRSGASDLTLTDNAWGFQLTNDYPMDLKRASITGPNGVGIAFQCCGVSGDIRLFSSTITVTDPTGINVDAIGQATTAQSSRLSGGQVFSTLDGPLTISDSRLSDVTVSCSVSNIEVTATKLVNSSVAATDCGETISGDQFFGPGSGTGVIVDSDVGDASVTGNTFTGWDVGIGLSNGGAILIANNRFRDNVNGIAPCSGPSCTASGSVTGNRFIGNSGTGLLLSTGTWDITSNVAVHNGGLGIDAEGAGLTVIDGGGNVANGNLAPQCVGVVCSP